MKRIVFYAWQSDLPNRTNRGFIQDALEGAARAIKSDDTVDIEPVIDRDTQGVAGSPDIAKTIFEKIVSADVVVADVSIISRQQEGRPTPNPNVLIELGYAFHALGHERVILVFNDAYGRVEELPFDLRMRRATTYNMAAESTERSTERKLLRAKLEEALRAALAGFGIKPKDELPAQRPKIRALSYGLIPAKGFHGLVICNDGEPAYDVSIPQIQVGTAMLNIDCDVPRLAHNTGDVPCQAWIEESSNNFVAGNSLFEAMRKQDIAEIEVPIHYRDEGNRWYRTLSKLERTVKTRGGLFVRYVDQTLIDSSSLPPIAHSESLPLLETAKPNIMMIAHQYLWLKTDENHIWRETWRDSGEGQKALLFTFLNNPDSNGKGLDEFSVRAQVTFEWDTELPGPNFSPVPWLGEELSFVDIPLGVEKKLVIGTGAGPQQGWFGYKSNRINTGWAKPANPLESNLIPDRGKMRVRIIASIDGKSEVIWMACFSWKIDFNPNHPRFHQIDCKDLKAV
jgi:hypothetical protein